VCFYALPRFIGPASAPDSSTRLELHDALLVLYMVLLCQQQVYALGLTSAVQVSSVVQIA
jgi:hypothetical protein